MHMDNTPPPLSTTFPVSLSPQSPTTNQRAEHNPALWLADWHAHIEASLSPFSHTPFRQPLRRSLPFLWPCPPYLYLAVLIVLSGAKINSVFWPLARCSQFPHWVSCRSSCVSPAWPLA